MLDLQRWWPNDVRLQRWLPVALAATVAVVGVAVAVLTWPDSTDDASGLRIAADQHNTSTTARTEPSTVTVEPSPEGQVPEAESDPGSTGSLPASATGGSRAETSAVTGASPNGSGDAASGSVDPRPPASPAGSTSSPTPNPPTAGQTGGPTTTATATPAPNPTSGGLYVDGGNSAASWAAANSSDPKAAAIRDGIGSKPIARWFGDWNPNIEADVRAYVDGARAAGGVPMLVAYNIPDRDCGQHSAGGAANFARYEAWIDGLADGLGDGPAFILLEPDSLALNGYAGSGRNAALRDAVATIKADCSACMVYLDAGHSSWVAPAEMAARLTDAGVLQADGFFSNVSNYNTTVSEQRFGRAVLAAIGNKPGLGQVIDTSRNGNGPPSDGAWCDPPGRAVGPDPTTDTGSAEVHALLWIKVPGEADGCIAGAGQFLPDRAYELVGGRR